MNSAKRDHIRHKRATDPEWRAESAAKKRAARRASDPEMEARANLLADHRAHVAAWRKWVWALSTHANAHAEAYQEHRRALAAGRGPKARGDWDEVAYQRAKSAWRRAKRFGRLAPGVRLADTLPVYRHAVALELSTGIEWHVDHRVPLRGAGEPGLHHPDNLEPLPRVMNQAKSNLRFPERVS